MRVLIFGGTTEGRWLAESLARAGVAVTLSVASEFGRQTAQSAQAAAATQTTRASQDAQATRAAQTAQATQEAQFAEATQLAKTAQAVETTQSAQADYEIITGPMTEPQMQQLLRDGGFTYVVDATHPYALSITEHVRTACAETTQTYLRLKRPPGQSSTDLVNVPDIAAAADWLKNTSGRVLLTTGAKQLEPFTQIANYAERFYLRILPAIDSLTRALELGFRPAHIYCMQGPFDYQMNRAILLTTQAKYLLTKDSGQIGGFEEKIQAALDLGVQVIVVARPLAEEGYSLEEIIDICLASAGEKPRLPELSEPLTSALPDGATASSQDVTSIAATSQTASSQPADQAAADQATSSQATVSSQAAATDQALADQPASSMQTRFFPLFSDLRGRSVLVVGGGRIAERRVKVLSSFGAAITLVSPSLSEALQSMAKQGQITWITREYQEGDITNTPNHRPFLVVAATSQRAVNQQVGVEARALDILVSVADSRDECTFYFPAIAENQSYIAGLVSTDGNHRAVKQTIQQIREVMN
ncbi:MAG: precorrin-6A reductase [Coriobacteriales bacterium]|jgi:precorrin-2 dehydrogenase/sirohydrochlorin ferrochelatase/precorrin-6A/cobalt-precorrin-6A reductase|nr:precorrin-6A reductase [Coriobacteriales bacterium]